MGEEQPLDAEGLRQRADAMLRAGAGETRKMPPEEVDELLYELRTHQIELELQNDELRASQAELVEARDRFQDLYDLAPVGYVTTSSKGLILEANLTLADMLGVDRGGLIGEPLSAYVVEDDQDVYFLHRRGLGKTGQRDACQLRIRSLTGDPFWALMEGVVLAADDGVHFLRSTISDVSERRLAEDRIAASLTEKELLLREIHHRVKNNMQVIVSLLRLQSATIRDPEVLSAFSRCADRVMAMAVVHEKLHGSDNLSSISCSNFVDGLVEALAAAHGADPSRITTDVGEVPLCLDSAVPLGLIITELASNALTHAFPDGQSGTIALGLNPEGDGGEVKLTVFDNGIGLPEVDAASEGGTLGLVLVEQLVKQQLGGTIAIDSEAGTAVTIIFKPSTSRSWG